ncbi:hypothetical protein Lal_00030399 [Lupinus albus]|nr:hypothetical protein Lal_00030399 [Lupinus albus]
MDEIMRDENENRTRRYLPEPNPNLTGKTRFDWVRVLPEFNFRFGIDTLNTLFRTCPKPD